ncbi:odorant receptor 128-10 [Festucalex cinctus]
MSNVTYSYFILSLYGDLGTAKYLAFVAVALAYASVVASNASLVWLICRDRDLAGRPMFILAASLFANQLFGSTAFFPFLATQMLSSSHTLSSACCFLQVFTLYSYIRVEYCTLAAMSYDRYLAVCRPLHYGALATARWALLAVLLLWAYSWAWVAVAVWLHARRPLCGNIIPALYCHDLVSRLLCGDSRAVYVYGLAAMVASVAPPLLPLLYSYARILHVVFSGRRRARRKALVTCAPHLASLLNFSFGCAFQIIHTRLDTSGALPHALQNFLSLYFLLIQPVVDPLVYGGQMAQIRQRCKKLLCWHHKELTKEVRDQGHKKDQKDEDEDGDVIAGVPDLSLIDGR